MENKNKAWTKWLFWFSLAIAVVAVYKTLDNFWDSITISSRNINSIHIIRSL